MDISLVALGLMTIINGYWTWQSRKIQNDRDIIKSLQLEVALKEEALQTMIKSKNVLKRQYENQLALTTELKGKLATYHTFHGHKPLA